MAEYDVSRVATIILRQFDRHGRAGEHTMPFDELPSVVRSELAAHLRCDADEVPVIADYRSDSHWTVLTTRRLIVRRESAMVAVAWLDFADFKVDLNSVAHLPDPKQPLDSVTVVTRSGENITISTDPGPPFLAFWNSLIMAKRMALEEDRRRRAAS